MTFRKTYAGAPAGFFAAEAAGLRWLAAAGPGAAEVVDVRTVEADAIELAELTPARPSVEAAADVGRALARTHGAGAAHFGSPPDGYDGPTFIGRQPMECRPYADWGVFYAETRVLPYLRRAHERGHVDVATTDLVERACGLLAEGHLDGSATPARLHGDLWSGNLFWTTAGAVLIDPAAHGGHPETDLAMLDLFGAPYLEVILAAYEETAPPADGRRDRVPAHQLHPLAVHAASHGASYAEPLRRAAERTLALA